MIIDFHNHIWPDNIAPKALGGNIPDMEIFGDGTQKGLLKAQNEAGIDLSVCLAVANTAAQLASANKFVGELDRKHFIPFGTIHPTVTPEENLQHLRNNDIKGVKLHPVFQGFRLDDKALFDTLAALEDEFCVITHVGDGGGSDGTACTPKMVATISKIFPKLNLIACHFGGYHRLDQAAAAFAEVPLIVDTSWPPSLSTLDPEVVRKTIYRHGVERVVFASDWPTASPANEVKAIRALGLKEEEENLILGGNAMRILNLNQ